MQALIPGTYLTFESGSCYKVIELIEDVISLKSAKGDTVVSYKIDHLKRLLVQETPNSLDDVELPNL